MIVVGRHKDIVLDSAFNSALRNIESIIRIVTKINLLIFFLHARKVRFDPLFTKLYFFIVFGRLVIGEKLIIGHK